VLPVPPSANQHSSLNLLIGNAQLVINFSYCLYGGARPAARGAGVRTLPHCGPQPANSAQRRPRLGSAASSSRTVPRHPPAPRYRSVPDSAKSAAGDLTRGQTRDWPRGARARALRATQSRRLECSPPTPHTPIITRRRLYGSCALSSRTARPHPSARIRRLHCFTAESLSRTLPRL